MDNARSQRRMRAAGRKFGYYTQFVLCNILAKTKKEKRTAEQECVNESFPSVVGIPSLMVTDGRACPSHVIRHLTHTLSLPSLLTLLRYGDDKSRRVQRTFAITSTSTCVRAPAHVKRQTAETAANRSPGPARRRKLGAEWYKTKVRVSTKHHPRTCEERRRRRGGNSGPEGKRPRVGQQASREARLGSSGVNLSSLGLGFEEAAF